MSRQIQPPLKFSNRLNSGTFGDVHGLTAHLISTKEESSCVLKVIKKGLDPYQASCSRMQLKNEIIKLSRISDADPKGLFPVVQFLGVLEPVEGVFGLLAERCETDLIEYFKQEKKIASYEQLSSIAKQCIRGLNFLENGVTPPIVHLDFKSDNILVSSINPLTIKISDFGLAVDSPQAACLNPRGCLKTASPEVALRNAFDTSADKWSLGCVLFQLRTHRSLFDIQDYQSLVARIHDLAGPIPKERLENLSNRNQIFEFPEEDSSSVVLKPEFKPTPTVRQHQLLCLHSADLSQNGPKGFESSEAKSFRVFLHGILKINPADRLSYDQMLNHNFITKYS
ncbi:MAG: hypothetical protein FJZ57_05500 [Chlamydiae bacterium]|nr:hypothetical protein [Chlamydiota bacterium]